MNAIENISWAINEIKRGTDFEYAPNRVVFLRKLEETLALFEAEKPADDAIKLAQSIYRDGGCRVMLSMGHYGALIQSYSETYHAKKCAECKAQEESCANCSNEGNDCSRCAHTTESYWQPLPEPPKTAKTS